MLCPGNLINGGDVQEKLVVMQESPRVSPEPRVEKCAETQVGETRRNEELQQLRERERERESERERERECVCMYVLCFGVKTTKTQDHGPMGNDDLSASGKAQVSGCVEHEV